MNRMVLILALLAAAYLAYAEYGPRRGLPTAGGGGGFTGSGSAPGKIVGEGAGRAAGGIAD